MKVLRLALPRTFIESEFPIPYLDALIPDRIPVKIRWVSLCGNFKPCGKAPARANRARRVRVEVRSDGFAFSKHLQYPADFGIVLAVGRDFKEPAEGIRSSLIKHANNHDGYRILVCGQRLLDYIGTADRVFERNRTRISAEGIT